MSNKKEPGIEKWFEISLVLPDIAEHYKYSRAWCVPFNSVQQIVTHGKLRRQGPSIDGVASKSQNASKGWTHSCKMYLYILGTRGKYLKRLT